MKALSLETSCDETAVAVVEKKDGRLNVLANIVSSQMKLHKKWGGVVPNLAAREHLANIVPVMEQALEESAVKPADLDLLAVTRGPGLIPALLVGVTAAKTLALLWQKPLLGIHHLEGHIYANLLSKNNEPLTMNREMHFPLLALLVSGGHTELVLMREHFQYEILGETQDDAAGEAFDKVARMLGLPYPGGPAIQKLAGKHQIPHTKYQIRLPRPMIGSDDYHFSFSGLKTAVLYLLKKHEGELENQEFLAAVAHEFQEAVVSVLAAKTKRAIEEYSPRTFVIAGGVSANIRLRERLQELLKQDFPDTNFLTPPFVYSLDNAAMIGAAALLRLERMPQTEREKLQVQIVSLEPAARLPLQ